MIERLVSAGGACTGLTVIVTSALVDSAVSLAVSRKTYVPEVENVAKVLGALAFANVTVPGPLNLDQVVMRVPFGKPSSVAVPERLASAVWVRGGSTTPLSVAAAVPAVQATVVSSAGDVGVVVLAVTRIA